METKFETLEQPTNSNQQSKETILLSEYRVKLSGYSFILAELFPNPMDGFIKLHLRIYNLLGDNNKKLIALVQTALKSSVYSSPRAHLDCKSVKEILQDAVTFSNSKTVTDQQLCKLIIEKSIPNLTIITKKIEPHLKQLADNLLIARVLHQIKTYSLPSKGSLIETRCKTLFFKEIEDMKLKHFLLTVHDIIAEPEKNPEDIKQQLKVNKEKSPSASDSEGLLLDALTDLKNLINSVENYHLKNDRFFLIKAINNIIWKTNESKELGFNPIIYNHTLIEKNEKDTGKKLTKAFKAQKPKISIRALAAQLFHIDAFDKKKVTPNPLFGSNIKQQLENLKSSKIADKKIPINKNPRQSNNNNLLPRSNSDTSIRRPSEADSLDLYPQSNSSSLFPTLSKSPSENNEKAIPYLPKSSSADNGKAMPYLPKSSSADNDKVVPNLPKPSFDDNEKSEQGTGFNLGG